MGFKYSFGQQQILPRDDGTWDPPNVINEEQWGRFRGGGHTLYYPNVGTCVTVTLHLSDNRVAGAHFSTGATAHAFQTLLGAIDAYRGPTGIRRIYLVGVLSVWNANPNRPGYDWPHMIAPIRRSFGYTGGRRKTFYYKRQPLNQATDYKVSLQGNHLQWYRRAAQAGFPHQGGWHPFNVVHTRKYVGLGWG